MTQSARHAIADWQHVVDTARDYYDSSDADNFYARIWGGEDIHIGLYRSADDDDIVAASRRTVEKMAARVAALLTQPGSVALDLGSGYAGSARFLAGQFSCRIDCLNLSKRQNERARRLCEQQGFSERIRVLDGSFEQIPFSDQSYDVVWSQDAILHSARRQTVLAEAFRVLKPGGLLLFTDPMQADDCPDGVLAPVLARIHLASLGSVAFYRDACQQLGFRDFGYDDSSEQLVAHYAAVQRELGRRRGQLAGISDEYIANMLAGLGHWIDAGKSGYLRWGIVEARKP
jgi:sarcosine/dimethylglycine N-methyltransferase